MYKIIEVVTVNMLAVDMEAAEQEGYEYLGTVANPGNSIVIMRKIPVVVREQPERFGFENMTKVADLVRDAVITDGEHHKQWYLEQIAERLELSLPDHRDGIAP